MGNIAPAIMAQYNNLIEKITFNKQNLKLDKIRQAFEFAYHAHDGQLRGSGEPYIIHPIAVASILADLRLDTESIVTALLHDTVEDTSATLEDITRIFGPTTAELVSGVTKLTKLEYQTENTKQAENFRKLLLAISKDIRVLLVKLADRVHNMNTLKYTKNKEKRLIKARETMDIYAPLAERIGIHRFKNDLQDAAFAELYPDIRNSILNRIEYLKKGGTLAMNAIEEEIRRTLQDAGIKAEVHGREKTCFSIWKKMEQKKVGFEQLTDIIAFRILVEDVKSCYAALGCIHTKYHTISNEFKDYISTPKSNGYKSLHTLIIGPGNRSIEVQIRTHEMHEVAELGVAAHWLYKQEEEYSIEGVQYRWVRELLSILENASSPEEFMENTKLEMFYDQVFCFSPKGDLIALPKGATPVDFAFALHSDIGLSCVGARVNGGLVPLSRILEHGDQIEILRSNIQMPEASWSKFVVTGKARAELRRFFRNQHITKYANLGADKLKKLLLRSGTWLSDELLMNLMQRFRKYLREELYAAIGSNQISEHEISKALNESTAPANHYNKRDDHRKIELPNYPNEAGAKVHLAECCYPMPNDSILAVRDDTEKLEHVYVHRQNCNYAQPHFIHQEYIIEARWLSGEDVAGSKRTYAARLQISAQDSAETIPRIVHALSQLGCYIISINTTKQGEGFLNLMLIICTENTQTLHMIITTLRELDIIRTVSRFVCE